AGTRRRSWCPHGAVDEGARDPKLGARARRLYPRPELGRGRRQYATDRMHEINAAICRLRECAGLEPIDDGHSRRTSDSISTHPTHFGFPVTDGEAAEPHRQNVNANAKTWRQNMSNDEEKPDALAALKERAQQLRNSAAILIRYVKGKWVAGRTELNGAEFIARPDWLLHGWLRLWDGQATGHIVGYVADNFVPPPREALGDQDRTNGRSTARTGIPGFCSTRSRCITQFRARRSSGAPIRRAAKPQSETS